MAVADWSGQAWLQGFNDAGLVVFGMPADNLVEIRVRSLRCDLFDNHSPLSYRNATRRNTTVFSRKPLATPSTSPVVPKRTNTMLVPFSGLHRKAELT